jgi:hypothetical protein
MRFPVKARHLAPRIATGAYILNAGLSKRRADEQTASGLHSMASGAYPPLGKFRPTDFVKLLSTGEIILGTALLLPVVPTALAGTGLAAFAGGLLGMYLRTPTLHQPGSLRPTPQGIAISKDVWMLGIGIGFLVDELTSRRER